MIAALIFASLISHVAWPQEAEPTGDSPSAVEADILNDAEQSLSADEDKTLSTDQVQVPQIKRRRQMADPRFRQEKRYIEHPNAEKGLIRIDKNKVYYYDVKPSEQSHASSIRVGTYEPVNLVNPVDTDITFDQIYEDVFPMLFFDHEWPKLRGKLGVFSWKAGAGLLVAQGHGVFENNTTEQPLENFTLVVMPVTFGASYRFQFWDTQPIVPYVEGGGDAFLFAEFRDDDQNPSLGAAFGAAPAAHFSIGGLIRLGGGPRAFVELDREYGINSAWIAAEYRNYVSFSDKYDFSGDAISGGLVLDF